VGVSTFELAATNAAANVIGGVAQRQLNAQFVDAPGTSGSAADELVNIAGDAVFGYTGARFGGQIADSMIPLRGVRREIEIAKFAHRRSTRAAREAATRNNWQDAYLRNGAISGVVGGAHSTPSSGWPGTFWVLFTRRTPPPRKKKEKDYEVDITITYQH
jgi:hypothetical protein